MKRILMFALPALGLMALVLIVVISQKHRKVSKVKDVTKETIVTTPETKRTDTTIKKEVFTQKESVKSIESKEPPKGKITQKSVAPQKAEVKPVIDTVPPEVSFEFKDKRVWLYVTKKSICVVDNKTFELVGDTTLKLSEGAHIVKVIWHGKTIFNKTILIETRVDEARFTLKYKDGFAPNRIICETYYNKVEYPCDTPGVYEITLDDGVEKYTHQVYISPLRIILQPQAVSHAHHDTIYVRGASLPCGIRIQLDDSRPLRPHFKYRDEEFDGHGFLLTKRLLKKPLVVEVTLDTLKKTFIIKKW